MESTRFQMVTARGNGFYAWDGKLYHSDIVRACIRPKVQAVGKLVAKHIRRDLKEQTRLEINPEPYLRFLLEDPNPYMSMQKLLEKMTTQLCLNSNAFAVVLRDADGYPAEIYPVPAAAVEAVYDKLGNLYMRFTFYNGKTYTFRYADVIHLRRDFETNDIFGENPAPALTPLMDIVSTMDQGLVMAIKNSGVIRWLLKFTQSMRPEDLQKQAKDFSDTFLSIIGETGGVAAVDAKADAKQIEPKDYVPNAAQTDRTTKRIYSFFNTNEKIVQSSYGEDDWNAYYEAEIEPVVLDLKNEFTRKLFTRRERGFGNSIVFEATNLSTASMSTKLNLCQMVDRGAMLPNEWRAVLNLAPLPGGDEPIRRLDTAVVNAVANMSRQLGGKNDAALISVMDRLMKEVRG